MDFLQQLHRKTQDFTQRSAFDGRHFVLVGQIADWLREQATGTEANHTRWDQLCLSLVSSDLISASEIPQLSLGRYMRIICVLLDIECLPAIRAFLEKGLEDEHLPLDSEELAALETAIQGTNETRDFGLRFSQYQLRYVPVHFDLQQRYQGKPDAVLPILSKDPIENGQTAQIWRIVVPNEFVSNRHFGASSGPDDVKSRNAERLVCTCNWVQTL
jgi:hypothetical protein